MKVIIIRDGKRREIYGLLIGLVFLFVKIYWIMKESLFWVKF